MSNRFWRFILWLEKFGYKFFSPEYKGYRKAKGGRWGQWEIRWRANTHFKIWLKSTCEHYPRPPLATSTEPINVEEYL